MATTMRLDADRLQLLSRMLEQQVQAENIPGAVVAVGIGPETHYLGAFGFAQKRDGAVRAMTEDTIFDLASLTKVVATLPSILCLVDDGVLRLNDPVSLFIPEFAHDAKASVTIRHLLTHTAGLVSHRPYYTLHPTRDDILQAIRNETLLRPPGSAVEYSDLGFILLGEIVTIASGLTLPEFASRRVFVPLRMADTTYRPPAAWRPRIAASEQGKCGVVHDENAEALEGVAGHAGLFSTLSDLRSYVQMWLGDREGILSAAARALAVRSQTAELAGNRGLGFVCRFDPYDHTGDLWPLTTVGHTGFTGTSLAFDPVSSLWMIILTNAVHYGREKRAIIRLRGQLHNLVGSAIRNP